MLKLRLLLGEKEISVRLIAWLLTLLIIVGGVAFAALNSEPVAVNYMVGKRELPLAVIILISFACGIILSIFILGTKVVSLSAKNKWLTNKLKKAEDQLSQTETS